MTKKFSYLLFSLILVGCFGSSFNIKKDNTKVVKPKQDKIVINKLEKDDVIIEESEKIVLGKKEKEEKKEKEKKREIKRKDKTKKEKEKSVQEKKEIQETKLTYDIDKLHNFLRRGEYLKFNIQYMGIKAGTGILSIPEITNINGNQAYHFKARAYSASPFSWVFNVNDIIQSYLDYDKGYSLKITKNIREGSYTRSDNITFLQNENKVEKITNGQNQGKIDTIPNALDILSAFYVFRTLDLEVGKTFSLPVYDVEKSYHLKIKVLDKEIVEVPAGEFKAYKVKPVLESMGLFKHKGDILLWISADENRIPLVLKSSIMIGSVYGVLVKHKIRE